MRKSRYLLAAVVAALFALTAVVPASAAVPRADNYPDFGVTITIDPASCAGKDLPFSVQASVSGDWTVTYDGHTRHGSGKNFSGTFPTKSSDVGKRKVLVATLDYDDGIAAPAASGTRDVQAAAAATVSDTASVVLPACGATPASDTAALPGTGSDLSPWWIVLALGAISVGGGLVLVRRHH